MYAIFDESSEAQTDNYGTNDDKVQVDLFLKSDTFVIPPISKDKNNISFPRRLLDVELKN